MSAFATAVAATWQVFVALVLMLGLAYLWVRFLIWWRPIAKRLLSSNPYRVSPKTREARKRLRESAWEVKR